MASRRGKRHHPHALGWRVHQHELAQRRWDHDEHHRRGDEGRTFVQPGGREGEDHQGKSQVEPFFDRQRPGHAIERVVAGHHVLHEEQMRGQVASRRQAPEVRVKEKRDDQKKQVVRHRAVPASHPEDPDVLKGPTRRGQQRAIQNAADQVTAEREEQLDAEDAGEFQAVCKVGEEDKCDRGDACHVQAETTGHVCPGSLSAAWPSDRAQRNQIVVSAATRRTGDLSP